MLTLEKHSFGVGDRFAHQAKAQLRACMMAAKEGAEVVPVWNKSHREHTTIGSEPPSVRVAADAARGRPAHRPALVADLDVGQIDDLHISYRQSTFWHASPPSWQA